MPRGRKTIVVKTLEERIAEKQGKIDELKAQLEVEEADLKTLIEQKNLEALKKIQEAIQASGKSIDEVLAVLKSE